MEESLSGTWPAPGKVRRRRRRRRSRRSRWTLAQSAVAAVDTVVGVSRPHHLAS